MKSINKSLFLVHINEYHFIMLIRTGKKMDKKKIDEALKKIAPSKVLDAKLHKGKVKWGEDALVYQKRMRDEWN